MSLSPVELRLDLTRNSRSVLILLQQVGVHLCAAKRLSGAGGLSEEEVTHVRSGSRGKSWHMLSL